MLSLRERAEKAAAFPICPPHPHPESLAQRRGGVFELVWGGAVL
jgi:hypothetical protein